MIEFLVCLERSARASVKANSGCGKHPEPSAPCLPFRCDPFRCDKAQPERGCARRNKTSLAGAPFASDEGGNSLVFLLGIWWFRLPRPSRRGAHPMATRRVELRAHFARTTSASAGAAAAAMIKAINRLPLVLRGAAAEPPPDEDVHEFMGSQLLLRTLPGYNKSLDGVARHVVNCLASHHTPCVTRDGRGSITRPWSRAAAPARARQYPRGTAADVRVTGRAARKTRRRLRQAPAATRTRKRSCASS